MGALGSIGQIALYFGTPAVAFVAGSAFFNGIDRRWAVVALVISLINVGLILKHLQVV